MKRTTEDCEEHERVEGSAPRANKRAKRPRLKWGLRRGPITGLRGVLATCSVGCEQRCANEISQFLDTIAAHMLGEDDDDTAEKEQQNKEEEHKEEEGHSEVKKKPTLEEMLAAERAAMEAEGGSSSKSESGVRTERLQAMYSGVNGVIFVRVLRDALSPTALCRAAAEAAARADCPMRLRHTVRVIPLERTCQVNCADITHTLAPILRRALLPDDVVEEAEEKKGEKAQEEAAKEAAATKGEEKTSEETAGTTTTEEEKKPTEGRVKKAGTTYHVEFRSRNCSAVHRQDGINAVLHAMPEAELFARAGVCMPVVQFKGSDVAVIVELFKSTCGVAVAPDFDRYKQYNLRALQDDALLSSSASAPQSAAPQPEAQHSEAPAQDSK